MSEKAIKHQQSFISETEDRALDAFQQVSMTATTKSRASRELLIFALTKLGYLENCNGNITDLVARYKKPKTEENNK